MAYAMKHSFKLFDHLKKSGIPESQARGIIEVIEESTDPSLKDLATKSDLKDFTTKSDLRALETSMGTRMDKMENDISWLKRMFFGFMLILTANVIISLLHL